MDNRSRIVEALLGAGPQRPEGGLLGQPATMNPNIARQGAMVRGLMAPPTSVMDERYPAWKKSQDQADRFLIASNIALSAAPFVAPLFSAAGRNQIFSNLTAPSPINAASRRQAGMIKTMDGRYPETGAEARKLADMLERAGSNSGYSVHRESSKISPSQYVTWRKGDIDEFNFRVSNHNDYHRVVGRPSIDPSDGGMSLEQAVIFAREKGFNTPLATKFQNSLAKAESQAKAAKLATDAAANDMRRAYLSRLPEYSGGRLDTLKEHYSLYTSPSAPEFRLHKSLIPAEIKANPDKQVLVDYLLQKAQTPR